MVTWQGAVESLGIPHPRTVFVPFAADVLRPLFYGEPAPDLEKHMAHLINAAKGFTFPLFLRTDLSSGKHSWLKTCYVPSLEALPEHAIAVAEQNEMADLFGLEYEGFALREFVELDSTFTAFDGMPVSAERRYFAEGGKVLCHHPYWFEDAIERGDWRGALPDDWRERLAILNDERGDPDSLALWASAVTKLLPGAWSVDFARLRNRRDWILIDMALADSSWHPEHDE